MELNLLKNIGKEMRKKLKAIGVENAEALREIGSKETFFRLKMQYPEVCLVHLYAIQGAIDDIEFNNLAEDVKKDLKAFSDSL